MLSACAPCVRESFPVAALVIAPGTVPGSPPGTIRAAARPAEIAIDVVRAQQLGRRDWVSVALRVTLSLAAAAGGDKFRLATGLLDGSDARPLAHAVAEMVKLATAPPATGVESTDVDYHGGSLRVGVLRRGDDAIAYVQAGDLPVLLQRAVSEVPTTVYLPVKDLPALAAALGQAAATIDKVRETR